METLFIGQKTFFLAEIGSTNSYAMEMLKEVNPMEGTIVYTYNQTQGRGQRGNSWMSEPGRNLAVSIILKPHFLDVKNVHFLYLISALSIHDLLTQILNGSQFDIKIKWPNDILVNGKKIAGILNETIIQNARIPYAISGIGINVNQVDFKTIDSATSIRILTGKENGIKGILDNLCAFFESYYLQLKQGQYDAILAKYYAHLYKKDQSHLFRIGNERKQLLVCGISNTGLLHLKDSRGSDLYFDVKEIQWD